MQTKYIFITGGVCSSLGKGLTAAAIGLLLEKKGLKIGMLKCDPYLNIDPGTMSPFQHGEVYVTDDGAETDLDLGHYYRYTNSYLSRASNITTGQIYDTIIKRERKGDYLGKTVQVIPHVTDEIKSRIVNCGKQQENCDVVLVEFGGTVGDIELQPFIEAIRQLSHENRQNCLHVHLTYVPYIKAAGEVKTKPSQHSVQMLGSMGIFPDMIICRCERSLEQEVKDKISLFSNVKPDCVIEEVDVKHSIYEVPLRLHEQKVDSKICEMLGLKNPPIRLDEWQKIIDTILHPKGTITVGVVGKYILHQDAYKSVYESLFHGALAAGYSLQIKRFEADKLPTDPKEFVETIKGCDGYLIPGGFGERGWFGKIRSAQYCRENKIPYFGICLGMHVMAVEFARNVLGLKEANSTEFEPHAVHPVISMLNEQTHQQNLGGTMRLGAYLCELKPNSLAHKAYGKSQISERHRHRYELNNEYRERFEKAGFNVVGTFKGQNLCEIAEIEGHPWMVGVQFHPEFKSKPTDAHPLFRDFIQAVIKNKEKHE